MDKCICSADSEFSLVDFLKYKVCMCPYRWWECGSRDDNQPFDHRTKFTFSNQLIKIKPTFLFPSLSLSLLSYFPVCSKINRRQEFCQTSTFTNKVVVWDATTHFISDVVNNASPKENKAFSGMLIHSDQNMPAQWHYWYVSRSLRSHY